MNPTSRRSFLSVLPFAAAGVLIHASRSSLAAKPNDVPPGSARILKVLPHFLDQQGRHTINPSLFDRDAYQFELRQNPALRSGMRFDVLWKGLRRAPSAVLTMKIEMRGSLATAQSPVVVSQRVFASSGFNQWTRVPVVGDNYQALGELSAWRVSLWRDETPVAEQTSFLW